MKISTSLEHAITLLDATPETSAAMMKQAGFDGVDLSMCHDQEEPEKLLRPEWAEAIRRQSRAAQGEGLEILQCHLPYYGGHLPLPGAGAYQDYEDFMLPGLVRGLELCGEIGCPVAVMHPFFDVASRENSLEGNLRLIERLLPHLKKNGVRLALENVYGHDGRHYIETLVSRPEGILEILNRGDGDWVGACIDTGHANIFRIDIGQMARSYGKRLIALHVNGNAGHDEHVVPYTMSGWCEHMDYRDFSAALREIGFSGSYNLEINPGRMPPGAVQAYLNYAAAMARGLAEMAEY